MAKEFKAYIGVFDEEFGRRMYRLHLPFFGTYSSTIKDLADRAFTTLNVNPNDIPSFPFVNAGEDFHGENFRPFTDKELKHFRTCLEDILHEYQKDH